MSTEWKGIAMARTAILTALLFAACKRAPAPGAPTEYHAPDGSFSARLPSDWQVDETSGETRKAAFFGPPKGEKPFSQLMGIYFHAATDPAAAERNYLASAQDGTTPVREVTVGDTSGLEAIMNKTIPDVHSGMQRVVMRTVVVSAPGGFFSLEHTWPVGVTASPAFDEMIRSFRSSPTTK